MKPVQGPDGNRVPLLRPGFRPTDAYEVSFVFMHSGAPFAKKGGSELSLPSMDVPISLLQWEVFLPEQYKVKDFGGDAIAMNLLRSGSLEAFSSDGLESMGRPVLFLGGAVVKSGIVNAESLLPGQLGGIVVDPSGAVISGAQVKVTSVERGVTQTATTDSNGRWVVSGMPSGRVKIEASARNFKTSAIHGDNATKRKRRTKRRSRPRPTSSTCSGKLQECFRCGWTFPGPAVPTALPGRWCWTKKPRLASTTKPSKHAGAETSEAFPPHSNLTLHTSSVRLCSRDRSHEQSARGRELPGGCRTRRSRTGWDADTRGKARPTPGKHGRRPPANWD